MPGHKESSGRSGRHRGQLSQREGEKDEDYVKRRERNNEAVRKSRNKSKKKTEETLKRVDILKMENSMLEGKIVTYRKQLADLKEIFLSHAGSGSVNLNIDFDALLKDSDVETEEQMPSSTNTILGS